MRSLTVEGVDEDDAGTKGSIERLKHQFLPFTGNTTNLALIIPLIKIYV